MEIANLLIGLAGVLASGLTAYIAVLLYRVSQARKVYVELTLPVTQDGLARLKVRNGEDVAIELTAIHAMRPRGLLIGDKFKGDGHGNSVPLPADARLIKAGWAIDPGTEKHYLFSISAVEGEVRLKVSFLRMDPTISPFAITMSRSMTLKNISKSD
jgi:hypothetical protein